MPKKAENKTSKKKSGALSGKNTVRIGATTAVVLSGFAAYQAFQAVAATATLPILANLVRAIELTINTTLDFGTLAMTVDRAGRATLGPGVNRLFIDDNSSLSLAGGKPTAGRLFLKGAEFPVAISLDDTIVKLTNGTGTVQVGDFNLITAQGGTKVTFTPTNLDTYSFSIPIGATIKTRTGQISGTYVGATRIFASYQ